MATENLRIVFENVAPHVGPTTFDLTGPGLYALVAPNASGKSHRIRLLERLGDLRELGKLHAITDGEEEASVEVGGYVVRFRRNPRRGEKPVEEAGAAPAVDTIPSGIATLIDGGGLKGEEPRARARLEALLGYVPVETTIDRLASLLRSVDLDAGELEPDVRRTWQRVGQAIAVPRTPWMPLELTEEIGRTLRPEVGKGLLEVHGRLLDHLNALGLRAEKIADAYAVEFGMVAGEVASHLSGAASAFGLSTTAEGLIDRILETPDPATAERTLRDREHERAMVEAAHQHHANETARRERLRASHGERPDVEKAAGAVLLADSEVARLAAIEQAEAARVDAIRRQLADAEQVAAVAKANRVAATREAVAADETRQAVAIAADRWQAVAAQLAEPLTGPSDEELSAAFRAVETAREISTAARAAALYRDAATRLEHATAVKAAIVTLGEDYRRSAQDSWAYLGDTVTQALALPWLRVRGMLIEVGYQRSGERAPIATAEHPAKDWRDLDDAERISSAELRDAMLTLLIERRAGGSAWITLPWAAVLSEFEDERLRALAARLEAAGIVAIFERPRRDGEPAEIVMEKI